jgi:hypothetical protein
MEKAAAKLRDRLREPRLAALVKECKRVQKWSAANIKRHLDKKRAERERASAQAKGG